MPISIIKAHVESDSIRTTPIETNYDTTEGAKTKPSSDDKPSDKRARKRPRISDTEGYDFMNASGYDDNNDDEDESEEGFVRYTEYNDEEGLEHDTMELTPRDIEYLHSTLFHGESAQATEAGRAVLESKHLCSPPDPRQMKNRYSAVLGDVFHAMARSTRGKEGFLCCTKRGILCLESKEDERVRG